MRSTLVEQTLLDEYLELAQDEVCWARMWKAFFKKEGLFSNWARSRHEAEAQAICEQYNLPADAFERIADSLDASLLTGLFIGERRLEIQRGESDWLSIAFEMDPKEPDR